MMGSLSETYTRPTLDPYQRQVCVASTDWHLLVSHPNTNLVYQTR